MEKFDLMNVNAKFIEMMQSQNCGFILVPYCFSRTTALHDLSTPLIMAIHFCFPIGPQYLGLMIILNCAKIEHWFLSFSLVFLEPEEQTTVNTYPGHTSIQQQETSPPPTENRLPSPARFPESEAIHLKNLVRPFTLNQLKDLLRNYGPLVEDGFWIDKIKSHCYVVVRQI